MYYLLGTFRKALSILTESCNVLEPVQGFSVRAKIECATACINQQSLCEGFIYLPVNKLCKLVGTSGRNSSSCDGDIYHRVIFN